ncbi:MAG TPA: type I DNA topoisomerase [Candidatus Thermoplasmatota archaeon]|nr:type I DNA topoisomerase [Candidatus Thermoplasmatota archaeon]
MPKLVIVESPTKSKKIQGYLPKGYTVDSCVGHIRDLPQSKAAIPAEIKGKPWADYGVDVEHDFTPYYVTIPGKEKVLRELRAKLKDADELFLATDEDREGESISWHLVEALKPKVPVRRMVFNEITKEAVLKALAKPRGLDLDLVQAQETRRILDRLYGYALSPLLWKKVGGGLSAGRVQSVAVRLVVMRERERRAFRAASYWGLTALLEKGSPFEARLVSVAGKRIATGKDFDKDTGKLAAGKTDLLLLEEPQARQLERDLAKSTWTVTDVTEQQRQSSPEAPFVTSTLQQEGNNRLNLSAKQTMQAAQRLFENGFITYMRTDSTALSEEAVKGARSAVAEEFGADYLHGTGRDYSGKQQKGAQEAHEAIRPAGSTFKHPDQTGLGGVDLNLYRLIWQRTLASQMANERYTSTTVTLAALTTVFTATGKRVDFAGYRAAYGILTAEEGEEGSLPAMAKGDKPRCTTVTAEGHETKPPARYTEASLVKALVEERIGRPSTYAAIIETIQNRGYVAGKGKALVPTFTAFAVVGLLEKHFPRLVDLAFTAEMEEKLDLIAAGKQPWVPFLAQFFLGPDGLQAQIKERLETIPPGEGREVDLEGIPAGVKVRIGRFGPYIEVERGGERLSASLPESITPDELDEATVERLLKQKAEGPLAIGEDPETGSRVFVMDGRFGPYYQLGTMEEAEAAGTKPKRASLPKGRTPDNADLDEALFLLSLPKELGEHPQGGRVIVGLGRFGPYVAHDVGGKLEYRSIQPAQLGTIELEQALALLAEPKRGRGQRGAATALREMGPHPADGQPVRVLDGRFGPYLKHGDTNATLPRGTSPEAVTMEQAVEILAERAARGPPAKKRPSRRSSPKKAAKKPARKS